MATEYEADDLQHLGVDLGPRGVRRKYIKASPALQTYFPLPKQDHPPPLFDMCAGADQEVIRVFGTAIARPDRAPKKGWTLVSIDGAPVAGRKVLPLQPTSGSRACSVIPAE